MEKNTKAKRIKILAVLFLLLIPTTQFTYFYYVFHHCLAIPDHVEMVLIYSGSEDRIGKNLDWAKGKGGPLFLCSGWDFSKSSLVNSFDLEPTRMLVEDKALTTDQNARYCAPLIRDYKPCRIALALPWFHLPRALFLTRYYLRGTGITVIPYATISLPDRWWASPRFHLEVVKFWGSLGRVALAWVRIENWPKPQLINSAP